MAIVKITSLTVGTSTATNDVVPFVDVSDSSQAPSGTTKQITVANLFGTIPTPVIITSTSATQFQVKYDGSNHVTVAVSSAGAVTLNATGASASFLFSDSMAVGTSTDPFGRGYTSRFAVTGSGSSAIEINAATGNSAALDFGVNATRYLGITVSGTSGEIGALNGATLTLATAGVTRVTVAAASGDVTFTGALSGITTLTATTLAGTLSTAAQPNVTSLGTLTGLTMGGALTMGANTLALASATVSGTPTWSSAQAITLSTAAQPNVTSLGTLTGLTVSGTVALAGATITGAPTWSSAQAITVSTAAQPNITSVGVLAALTVDAPVVLTNGGISGTFNASDASICMTSTSAPGSTPTGGGILYVEGGALKYIGTLGTITTVAPP